MKVEKEETLSELLIENSLNPEEYVAEKEGKIISRKEKLSPGDEITLHKISSRG